ncbi:MAG: hypothetical protein IJB00_02880, partial [Akkermansia sp.]|nr:hypothetical protein [Akkermansia sp.]
MARKKLLPIAGNHTRSNELLNKWKVNEKYKVKWTMDKVENSDRSARLTFPSSIVLCPLSVSIRCWAGFIAQHRFSEAREQDNHPYNRRPAF